MGTLFGYFFGVVALQHLIKPARNAFFLSTAGAENLPWGYIGSAIASVPAMIAYGRWMAPMERDRMVLGTLATVAASLVLFWVLLLNPTGWVAGAFYVWVNVFSLFLMSQSFLVLNDLFDPRQAKRVFGLIGAGAALGGVTGAAAAGFLASEIGSENLLWIAVGLLAGCGALAVRLFRVGEFRTTGTAEGTRDRGGIRAIAGGLTFVRRSTHLQRIAVLLFLTILVSTFVDWIYNAAVEAAHPGNPERMAEFIGQSFLVFNLIALALNVFATSLALRILGLAGALVVLPASVAMGAAGVLLIPTIWTAAAAKGADVSLRYSLDQSAREILFLPVPTVWKERAKPFIDIVVQRFADALAGGLILLAGGLALLSIRGLAVVTLVLAGVWVVWIWRVRVGYRDSLERLLAVRDVDLEKAVEAGLDSEVIRELRQDLRVDADPEEVLLALDLMSELPPGLLRDEAIRLLEHPDAEVRARAVEVLETAEVPDQGVIRPLTKDPDPRVRARARLFLCRSQPAEEGSRIRETFDEDDPHLLEAALTCLIERGDEDDVHRAGQELSRWVRRHGASAAPMRAACARALGRLSEPHPLQQHLQTLLADADPDVVTEALEAAVRVPRADLVSAILPHLEDPDTRTLAAKALAAHGEDGIPFWSASLRDPNVDTEVRRWLPGVFVRIESRTAYRALLESLPSVRASNHRLYALKALNKMRRRHPGWVVDTELVRSELDRELETAYESQRMLVTLDRSREDGLPKTPARAWGAAVRFRGQSAVERAFRIQGLLYRPRTIYYAYVGLTAGDTIQSAHALELLETVLEREDAARLLPLIDPDRTLEQRAELGRGWYSLEERALEEDLRSALTAGEPWLQAYAAELAGTAFADSLEPELERLAASGPELVRPLARRALRSPGERALPMSPVEKAAALRKADLLAELGADDLLQLAAVAEEQKYDVDDYLFFEGEEGAYLYVLLEGRVRLEREGQEIHTAGPGDTIGTFSIFDRRPRSASGIVVEPLRTLAIHREDITQIFADNYSLVEDIFGYLTGIIREMNEKVYSAGSAVDEEADETS
ncbi:MAG: cyclic nucleotide-binding domain-containing protein [Gemmatimonadota bacterium]|nr:cyclic nucleotide-binding domain-containing protein [Gemmatimonadota bacterium]